MLSGRPKANTSRFLTASHELDDLAVTAPHIRMLTEELVLCGCSVVAKLVGIVTRSDEEIEQARAGRSEHATHALFRLSYECGLLHLAANVAG